MSQDPVLSVSDDLEWYQRSGIVAVQTTPLITRGGQIVGMISTHWNQRHRPGDRELGHFDILARQAADLIERRAAEAALERERQRQQTLLAELQHRVRNILAMIRSMVVRASVNKTDVPDFVDHLQGRISALARTQAILTRRPGADVDLEQILRDEMLADATRDGKVKLSGRAVSLSPKAAEVLTLAVHELSTNSLKYGALGGDGKVVVNWKVRDRDGRDWLVLIWRETGVEISDLQPTPGFGTELITQRVPYELGGSSKMEFGKGGLKATMEFPLKSGSSVRQTDGVLKEAAD